MYKSVPVLHGSSLKQVERPELRAGLGCLVLALPPTSYKFLNKSVLPLDSYRACFTQCWNKMLNNTLFCIMLNCYTDTNILTVIIILLIVSQVVTCVELNLLAFLRYGCLKIFK